MDFNANSIAESCVPMTGDSCVDFAEFYGREITFFHGIKQKIILPSSRVDFAVFDSAPELIFSIENWCRLFRRPGPGIQNFDLIASICVGEAIRFDHIRFLQKDPKRGGRSPVLFQSARSLNREQLIDWLIDLAAGPFTNRGGQYLVMQRPPVIGSPLPRMAWVGQPIFGEIDFRARASAIGRVYGTEIIHLPPRTFKGTMADLKMAGKLDCVYLDPSVAMKFGPSVVPDEVGREMIFTGQDLVETVVETELRTVAELVSEKVRLARFASASQADIVLCAMIRPMLAHSKIGQFSHCSRETLFTSVRAKKLNMALAEQLLDGNSEQFADSAQSDRIFLWKAHNEGDQYFLNARCIPQCKAIIQRIL